MPIPENAAYFMRSEKQDSEEFREFQTKQIDGF